MDGLAMFLHIGMLLVISFIGESFCNHLTSQRVSRTENSRWQSSRSVSRGGSNASNQRSRGFRTSQRQIPSSRDSRVRRMFPSRGEFSNRVNPSNNFGNRNNFNNNNNGFNGHFEARNKIDFASNNFNNNLDTNMNNNNNMNSFPRNNMNNNNLNNNNMNIFPINDLNNNNMNSFRSNNLNSNNMNSFPNNNMANNNNNMNNFESNNLNKNNMNVFSRNNLNNNLNTGARNNNNNAIAPATISNAGSVNNQFRNLEQIAILSSLLGIDLPGEQQNHARRLLLNRLFNNANSLPSGSGVAGAVNSVAAPPVVGIIDPRDSFVEQPDMFVPGNNAQTSPLVIQANGQIKVSEIQSPSGETHVVIDASQAHGSGHRVGLGLKNAFNPLMLTQKPGEDPPEPERIVLG